MRQTTAIGIRTLACGALMFASLTAHAQDIPNLVGTWKGSAKAVFTGSNPYRVQENNNANFGDNIVEFIFDVKEQRDSRFAGELTTGKFKESFIGALQPPNFRTGLFLDHDGEYSFTMRDTTTIDLCYRHINPTSRVVACYSATKQP